MMIEFNLKTLKVKSIELLKNGKINITLSPIDPIFFTREGSELTGTLKFVCGTSNV